MVRRPVSVAIVLPTYLPETFGGAEQQTRRFADALARRGHKVILLAPRLLRNTLPRERDGGVSIRRFRLQAAPNLGGRHIGSHAAWWAHILSWLWRHRVEYDLIHVIHGRLHAAPAVVGGSMLGKPTLVKIGRGGREHFDLDVVYRKRLIGGLLARAIIHNTGAFVANSREIVGDLRRWGVSEARIHRIPNGVEVPQLDAVPTSGDVLRFVSLGRLDREKGFDLTIRGFARLPKDTPARLTIIGDGPCRKDLETLTKSLGMTGRITFTGALDDVAPALQAADIYVSTSLSEGMSNALLEAMSFGLLPLVSRVSGATDIVEDGRSGLLFDPGNMDAFSSRLAETLALSLQERGSMQKEARATIHREFDIDLIAEQHAELYRTLVGIACDGDQSRDSEAQRQELG